MAVLSAMDITLTPSITGKFIAENSAMVKIDQTRIPEVAKMILADLKNGDIVDIDFNSNPLHPPSTVLDEKRRLNWVLLLDTLNFSFWADPGCEYYVEYEGTRYNGYMAFCAAIKKAFDNGVDVTSCEWMATVSEKELGNLLRSDSGYDIPMLRERVEVLHETAEELQAHYDGQFENVVRLGENSVQTLLRFIIKAFPSFNDQARFNRQKVSFFKRAQILISDAAGALKGTPLGTFNDLGTLTMFADYRVPQSLAHLGVFVYDEQLNVLLRNHTVLPPKDQTEMELRGCSIYACDEIVRSMNELRESGYDGVDWSKYDPIHAIHVDVWLWMYRVKNGAAVDEFIPHHRTRSIYY